MTIEIKDRLARAKAILKSMQKESKELEELGFYMSDMNGPICIVDHLNDRPIGAITS